MKRTKLLLLSLMLFFLLAITSCANDLPNVYEATPSSGQIYLYGESHGSEKILTKELELWGHHYNNDGMRHLFVEYPYYTAEFLNIWMKSDNDDILNAIYDDWEGTQGQVPAVKDFYKSIKVEYPETIFHGTDVGHQYNSIGRRYLSYLEENGMKGSYDYSAAREAVSQGERYYILSGEKANRYREDKMVENFIREFDKLDGESVMGIYGSAHIYLDGITYTSSDHPCMANQLNERYVNQIHTEDISLLVKDIYPIRSETFIIDGKEYEASYFGAKDISSHNLDFTKLDFWRLENAYNDFANKPKKSGFLPYKDYIMLVESEQVFVIDGTKTDGSVIRMYYRSDGNEWEGQPVTDQFVVE